MLNGDVGRQLGNYRLLKLLGQGGFADVYLGEQIYLKTPAAIKVLRTHLSDDVLEQFVSEARTIARLAHPNIVGVLDFGIDAGIPFLVMPYAQRGSLRKMHPRGQMLPLLTIAAYVQQMAQALQYAHDHKIIHRDVKPENMLLGDDNLLKLSDFGIATTSHSTYTRPTQNSQELVAGTTTYMAPEQFTDEPTVLSDQYALAVVAYEWLCGQPPFVGADVAISFRHVHAPVPSLLNRVPHVSPAIELVVQRALAKDPRMRFSRISDFADDLVVACGANSLYSSNTLPSESSAYRAVVHPSNTLPSDSSARRAAIRPPNTLLSDSSARRAAVHLNQSYTNSESTFVNASSHPGNHVESYYQAPPAQPNQRLDLAAKAHPLPQASAPVPIHAERAVSRRTIVAGAAGLTVVGALGIFATATGVLRSKPLVSTSARPTPSAAKPTPVPATPTSPPTPATVLSATRPTVTSWIAGQFDLFVRGTDNALWQRRYDGRLHAWTRVASPLASDPAVTSWGANRFDLVLRGPNGDLQHNWFDGSWHMGESLGGAMIVDATVTSWGPGRLDVFICGTDHSLWHRYYDGKWRSWESLGGVFVSSPTAVAASVNSLDVFVRGTDNALWSRHYDGNWHDWQQLGGRMTSDPVVVSHGLGLGQIDVFTRGTDNTLQHIWYSGGNWQHWESLGGSLASAPAAVSWGPNRIDVFARSTNNILQHLWFDGNWGIWQPLG